MPAGDNYALAIIKGWRLGAERLLPAKNVHLFQAWLDFLILRPEIKKEVTMASADSENNFRKSFARLIYSWLAIFFPLTVGLTVVLFLGAPALAYLYHGISYKLAAYTTIVKTFKFDIFCTLYAGTIMWIVGEVKIRKKFKNQT